uniref:Cytochrome n=1 Tax=Lutzomyia longipalpis TaxID=7200 RepID=A0A1B0CV55_LUTLO
MLKGQLWREARTEITPAFTQLRMYPIMDEMCERLQKFILREKHEAIEARNMCANYTTEVLSSCIFGADAGALLDKKSPIREMGRKLLGFTPTIALYFFVIQLIPSLRKFIKIGLVPWNGWKFFVNLMEDSIQMRKGGRELREDYLSYLIELQAKKDLTTHRIMAHAMAFFVCGFETSSVVLSFALYQLAKNADIQEKLRNEIRKIVEKNGKLSYSVIQEMPYLEQVLCETHRLHPVFPILAKLCTESCEMPLTEHKTVTIEKGYSVILPLHSIHRDSRYYENPETFNPERFSPENGGSKVYRDRGCYLPFGDGPRICPGMRFAQTQIKAAIVAIVKDFEVKLDARTSLEPMLNPEEIIPTIIGGIWLRFTECREEI